MAPSQNDPRFQTPSERAARGGDVASQALNEALRVSFRLLTVAMVLVAALFVFSGIFNVKQHERAFILRFGRPVEYAEGPVLGPGFHFAWPFLVDEVVRFPARREFSLPIDTFWYTEPPDVPGRKAPDSIAPDQGSYNLTGDLNILHSQWLVKYEIGDPVRFCETLADPADLAEDKPTGTVAKLLTGLANSAIIRTMGRYNADDAYRGNRARLREDIKRQLTAEVQALGVGIRINDIILQDVSPPIQTKRAFADVTAASEERGKRLAAADGYRREKLARAEGEAKKIVGEAQAYKAQVVQEAESDAQYMSDLLKQYPDDRKMLSHFLRKRLVEVLTEVFDGAEEVYLLEKGTQLRLWLKRDPDAVREIIKRRSQEEEERKRHEKEEKQP